MKNKVYFLVFSLLFSSFWASSQNYNFEVNKVILSEMDQTVELNLKTNSFEALNFFNHSAEDFTIKLVDLESKLPLECDVEDFYSEQLSKKGLKEWHIILDAKDIGDPESAKTIRGIYNRIRSANLPQNAFVNVYILGDKLISVGSDFSKMPKFSKVVNLFDATDNRKTNFVEISNVFTADRKHVIALISNGEVGENIRSKDKKIVEERLIEKIQEYKDDIELYPIMYKQSGNNDFLIEMVNATSSLDDEMSIRNIKKLGKQKDGTFSSKDEFDFKLIAKPRQTKGNYYTLGNSPIQVICQYHNQKSRKRNSSQSSLLPTNPMMGLTYHASDYSGSIWFDVILGLGLIALILLILYLVIPIYNRFKFKKDHVFKYQDIKQAKRTRKDPLTMEEFSCDNDIVVFGEKMMLLDTWKYMKTRDDIETAKDFGEFFQGDIEGNIFTHSDSSFNWSFLAFFSGLAALLIYVIYQVVTLLGGTSEMLTLLKGLGLELTQSDYQVWLISIFSTLMGLGVFYFQNKLSDHSFWSIKTVWIPLVFGLVVLPMLYTGLVGSVINNGMVADLLWALLFATCMTLVIRKFPINEALKYLPSIGIGTVVYFLLMKLFDIAAVQELVSSSVGFAITAALGIGVQNQVLRFFDKEERIKYLKIIAPAGYSGTQLPLDVRVKKKWSIGNNPKNDIYIKWLDYDVRNDHCFIEFGKGVWTIFAYNGEIFKNGVLVSNGTELVLGDIIALGQNAITQFKFDEMAAEDIDTSGYANTGVQASSASTQPQTQVDQSNIVAPVETAPISQRIKIKPRNA